MLFPDIFFSYLHFFHILIIAFQSTPLIMRDPSRVNSVSVFFVLSKGSRADSLMCIGTQSFI